MIIDLHPSHIPYIEKFHIGDFPLPDVENKLYFDKKTVVINGQIQAAGFLKLTSEAILVLDPELTLEARVKLLDSLLKLLIFDLDKSGIEDTHVFLVGSETSKTARFLKRYGFVEATGKCMYLPPRGQNGKSGSEASAATSNL